MKGSLRYGEMTFKTLILEEEKEISQKIADILRRLEHEILAVLHSGEEAIEWLEESACDLLISGVGSSGHVDGVEVGRLAKIRYGSSVIFLTAECDGESLRRIATVRPDGCLLKPFREEELETAVRLTALYKRERSSRHDLFRIDDIYSYCFDCDTLYSHGSPMKLSERELIFLRALLDAGANSLIYERMDRLLWGEERVDPNTRRQFVHRFRKNAPLFPLRLVKGEGYRLEL